MQGDGLSEAVLDTIGDERTRTVLAAIAHEPGSVSDLTEQLNLSEATIYRRIDTLEEHGLVAERTLVADDGNHYSVYWSDFSGTVVALDGDEYTVHVLREGELPDALSEFREELSNR